MVSINQYGDLRNATASETAVFIEEDSQGPVFGAGEDV